MGQYQRKHQRKTRRVRFTWLYGVISALLILAAVVGGCIVFFRVDTINVQGNSRYTQEEIVAASGIERGDNMFLINKFQVIDQMISQLTYLDDVTIRRGLPSTLNVTVTECTVAGAVRNGENGEWWLVSSGGKLLERISHKGRKFYGCEHYPECDFVSWDMPVREKCPVCGSMMVLKRGRKGAMAHVCTNETCRHRVELAAPEGDDSAE